MLQELKKQGIRICMGWHFGWACCGGWVVKSLIPTFGKLQGETLT